jgi:hypothetical protein
MADKVHVNGFSPPKLVEPQNGHDAATAVVQRISADIAAAKRPAEEQVIITGILKKNMAAGRPANGVRSAVNGGGTSQAKPDERQKGARGLRTRSRRARSVRSSVAGGSESGLTNYEDDNASLAGWR